MFEDIIKQPTLKDWDNLHKGHKRLLLIGKDQLKNGPDLRVIKCICCDEYFVLDIIIDQELKFK